jgi:hypothetical protein
MRADPDVASSSVASMRTKVVFPEPLRPIKTKMPCAGIVKVTASSAFIFPLAKSFVKFSQERRLSDCMDKTIETFAEGLELYSSLFSVILSFLDDCEWTSLFPLYLTPAPKKPTKLRGYSVRDIRVTDPSFLT